MKLTDDQQLRLELFKETKDIKQARELYDFITDPLPELRRDTIQEAYNENPDGVFVVFENGTYAPWDPDSAYENEDSVTGIGIKQGDRSIMVALHDIGSYPLPKVKDANHITELEDAVDDFNGKDNTEILESAGLDFDITQDWWIPSVGELLLIFTHIKQVNEALRYFNGTPLEGWRWSSTSYGANDAWGVYFSSGNVNSNNVRVSTGRVRAVAAF